MTSRRARLGRAEIYFEPRDLWIGVYVAPAAIYVCPLPTLVVKVTRRDRSARARG